MNHKSIKIQIVYFQKSCLCFPWLEAAEIVNRYRSEKIDINNGRILNLRAHIGALIAQTMNGWTDRQTEEMVRYHAGVRLLCGLESTTTTMDRTRIEAFRNCVGKTCAEELNQMVLRSAMGAGFTGIEICAADTTVQESPIAYPTEVGHMKNIAEKILGFGFHPKGKIISLWEYDGQSHIQGQVRKIGRVWQALDHHSSDGWLCDGRLLARKMGPMPILK